MLGSSRPLLRAAPLTPLEAGFFFLKREDPAASPPRAAIGRESELRPSVQAIGGQDRELRSRAAGIEVILDAKRAINVVPLLVTSLSRGSS